MEVTKPELKEAFTFVNTVLASALKPSSKPEGGLGLHAHDDDPVSHEGEASLSGSGASTHSTVPVDHGPL